MSKDYPKKMGQDGYQVEAYPAQVEALSKRIDNARQATGQYKYTSWDNDRTTPREDPEKKKRLNYNIEKRDFEYI